MQRAKRNLFPLGSLLFALCALLLALCSLRFAPCASHRIMSEIVIRAEILGKTDSIQPQHERQRYYRYEAH